MQKSMFRNSVRLQSDYIFILGCLDSACLICYIMYRQTILLHHMYTMQNPQSGSSGDSFLASCHHHCYLAI